ncbi:MAG TPA: DUF4332 domain-containing protein [Myxococcota bacterium]|nr:DUF4332 domain-containing protein [Myxococcota bacterium]
MVLINHRHVILVFTLALSSTRLAMASHYDLDSIDLVDEAMVTKMAEMGIETTSQLLEQSAKSPKRLAKKLSVSVKTVREWRAFCSLLGVNGIGPKVAKVLTAGGIKNIEMLAKQDPDNLSLLIQKTNEKVEILGKVPEVETVAIWINSAKELTTKKGLTTKGKKKKGK